MKKSKYFSLQSNLIALATSALTLAFSAPSAYGATETFNSAGTFNWVCPAGVTTVQVECWGGGGAGGAGRKDSSGGIATNGGGGGGGAYARRTAVTVTPGNSYAINIPAAVISGANGTGVNNSGAVNGLSVTFVGDDFTTTAAGGAGGLNRYVASGNPSASGAPGGAGGTTAASSGDFRFAGGAGSAGIGTSTNVSGSGGGGAGNANPGSAAVTGASTTTPGAGGLIGGGNGGQGSPVAGNGTPSVAGSPGATPGGGGGGAKQVNTGTTLGGAGGLGQIILTYTGPTIVKADNIDNLAVGSSWVGGVVPGSANSVTWDNTVMGPNTTILGGDLTFGGILISDPGGLVTIDPGNTLTLGAAQFDLDLSNATQDLTVNCNLAMGAANVWNVASSRTLTLGGVVSGAQSVFKQGLGTAILSGVNTYSGTTNITAGTLVAGANAPSAAAGSFGNATSEIVLGVAGGNDDASILIGGVFDIGRIIRIPTNNTTDVGTRVLTLGGSTADNSIFSGNIFLGTTSQAGRGVTLTAAIGGQVTFSGVIQNPTTMDATAYTVTKSGDGTVELSNANTYTGATVVSDGTLSLSNSLALQNSPLDTFNSIVGDPANGLKTSVTTLQFGGLTGDKNLADVFTTPSGGFSDVTALTLRPGNFADSHVYTGVISDGAIGMTLNKTGAGAQTLSASNNYTGATTIAAGGALVVGADGALGTTAAGTTVAVNASLGLTGGVNYTTTELVSGAGAGTAGQSGPVAVGTRGFIQGVSGSSTFAGNIQLNADGISRIGSQDGASLTLTGSITQASGITTANILFRVGSLPGDFVTLSNAGNSFGGNSQIFTGTANTGYAGVRLGIDDGLPTNLTISSFAGTNATFTALDLNGYDQTLNGLITGGGALQIINLDTVNPSTLTLDPTANKSTSNTFILGGGGLGVIDIVKNGAFTQTLIGTNTFTGNIVVNDGKLSGGQFSLGASSNTRTITVESGAVLEFGTGNVFGGHFTKNVPNIIVNGGTITNDELVIVDPLLIKVNNALNNVTLNSGTITATEGNQNSDIDTVLRPGEGYGAWGLNGTVTSTGTSTINTGAVTGKGGRILLSSNTADTIFDVTSGTLTVSAPLQTGDSTPNYGLTKNGLGTLSLTAANIYTTNTTVNAGTLELADNAQLKFVTGATSGTNNSVTGVGTVTFDGDFNIDTTLTDATMLTTGSWTLVDASTLTETFNPSFTLIGAGWTQLANVWTKTVGAKKYTFTEATGILTLSPAASYASWINSFFPGETDPLIIGTSADPDFDCIPNGVEIVLGGNPATGMDASLLPTLELVNADPDGDLTFADYLLFTYRRSDYSVTAGVTADCETDTDLAGTWTAATGAPGVVILVNDNYGSFTPPATDTDRVRVFVPRGANTTLFGRLNVLVP